jgi:putative transposase
MAQKTYIKARTLLCYWAVRELGVSMVSLAKRLGISPAAVIQSVERVEGLAGEDDYQFP